MEQRWKLSGGGELYSREAEERVVLRAESPDDGRGLYKVWLLGAGEGELLLGTLAPEQGRLTLSRVMGRSELERAGCWPICGGRRVLVFPFEQSGRWVPFRTGLADTRDPVLAKCLTGGEGLSFRTWGSGFQLAQRWPPQGPLVLAPMACMAQADEEGLVWTFDGRGWPVLRTMEKCH